MPIPELSMRLMKHNAAAAGCTALLPRSVRTGVESAGWLCRVPQELPAEVNDLMQRCQEVDPKLRPSAKQVFEELSAAVGLQ